MNKEFVEILGENDVLYCKNCEELIDEESNYDWTFVDDESQVFTCPKCKTKYKVQISEPIEKLVFILTV